MVTVTPEMREAFWRAMRVLDLEVAELRARAEAAELLVRQMTIGQNIVDRVKAELAGNLTANQMAPTADQAAMIAYADDRPDEPINADQATAIGQEANEDWREMCVRLRAELAALRAKYDAITRDAISGIETVPSVEHYYEGLLDKRDAELAALCEFLRARGYAKGEDGTWGKMG